MNQSTHSGGIPSKEKSSRSENAYAKINFGKKKREPTGERAKQQPLEGRA